MKAIYEYEFDAIKNGKKIVVQQSAYDSHQAVKRIEDKDKDIKVLKLRRRLRYPHTEGGGKV